MFKRVNLGADPEVVVLDSNSGKVIPAGKVLDDYFSIRDIDIDGTFGPRHHHYRRTTKETKVGPVHFIEPTEPTRNPRSSIVVDGIAFEINPPTNTCKRYAVISMATGMNLLKRIIDRVNLTNKTNYKLSVTPAIYVSDDNLKEFPEQAAVFGCDPDMPIYGGDPCVTVDATKHNYRYFGGHLHMSFGPTKTSLGAYVNDELKSTENRLKWYTEHMYDLTQALDRLVGIGSTAISSSEEEQRRRLVYGQAGRVRIQPYGGLEYRTPSNSWLLDSSLYTFIMNLMQVANNIIFHEDKMKTLNDMASINDIVRIINTGNHEDAMTLFKNTMEALDHCKGMLNDDNPYPDNYYKYAQYVYDHGGAHKVFNPDEVSQRWNKWGFLPDYNALWGVDKFVAANVKSEDKPKQNNATNLWPTPRIILPQETIELLA